jgi:hypothetical protein
MSEAQATVTYKDLPGHPGYRVGDDGSVWTQWHKVGRGYRYGFKTVRGEDWQPMKLRPNRAGRLSVVLFPGAVERQVAHLVLEAFVGPCPPGMECCHDPDPDPANNRLPNVRWGTKESNYADRDRHGRTARGEKAGGAKLSEEQAKQIIAEYAAGPRYGVTKRLAAKFGVNPGTIHRIATGRKWKHLHLSTPPSDGAAC